MSSSVTDTKLTTFVYWQVMSYVSYMGAFHLRSLAGNIAGKLGNTFLRYQIRQPATRFPLTPTLAMLVIPFCRLNGKRHMSCLVLISGYVRMSDVVFTSGFVFISDYVLFVWLCLYIWLYYYVWPSWCLYVLMSLCLATSLWLSMSFYLTTSLCLAMF